MLDSPAPLLRSRAAVDPLFDGPGEMRALCRRVDWSATSLGPTGSWSPALRTTVGIVLGSRNPMFLFWGPDLIQIYNDAYRPSLGAAGRPDSRHPRALGMRGREFWTEIWDTIGPQIEQVMTTGEATWHEDQYLPIERNGRLDDVWWTYSYGPVPDDAGGVGGVLVVCQETTQRVQAESALRDSEARLRATYDGTYEYIGLITPDGTVVDCNRTSLEFVGNAREDVIGSKLWDTPWFSATPGAAEHVRAGVQRAAASEFVRYETTLHRPPKEPVTFDFSLHPIRDRTGAVVYIVPEGRDITERKRADVERERLLSELELERTRLAAASRKAERLLEESENARALAESANQVKAQFLTMMSHELRTPLNAIGGYTELLQLSIEGALTDRQRQFLDRIEHSQRHLLRLINEVLSFAKLETGSVSYDIRDVMVDDVLQSAEELVEPQARAADIDIAIDAGTAGLAARADEERLCQVLVNLMSNAVKFTPEGGRIDVIATRADGDVIIDVRDTGIGIPEDQVEAIFDPFVQVRSDLARPYDGTGLGLAISRDLARGMGGDLRVESTSEAGSTFRLQLPSV